MILTIDIGGTKTLLALFNDSGRVIKKSRFKTPTDQTVFLNKLSNELLPFSQKYRTKILLIVVAVPGGIKNNVAVWFGNRPWKNLDLADNIKNLFNCPIYLENDASLATIFESSFYSGLTLYLTFSTGIGGGLARTGHLAKNSHTVEPGHTKYIYANRFIEWEDIASCAALGKFYGCQATSIRGRKNYLDVATRISLGLPSLIQRYHPDQIVIGGPLALRFRHFAPALRRRLKTLLPANSAPVPLKKARRPKESTIYGAYLFGRAKLKIS